MGQNSLSYSDRPGAGAGGVLNHGSSREYSCIMVAWLGWGGSGTICIDGWGKVEPSDALIDQF